MVTTLFKVGVPTSEAGGCWVSESGNHWLTLGVSDRGWIPSDTTGLLGLMVPSCRLGICLNFWEPSDEAWSTVEHVEWANLVVARQSTDLGLKYDGCLWTLLVAMDDGTSLIMKCALASR